MDKPRKGRRKEDITRVYLNDKERKMKGWKEERRKEGRKEGWGTQQGRTYKSLNRCFSRIENSRKTRACSCPCYVSRGKALGRVSLENAWCQRKGIRASFSSFSFSVSPFLTALTIHVFRNRCHVLTLRFLRRGGEAIERKFRERSRGWETRFRYWRTIF